VVRAGGQTEVPWRYSLVPIICVYGQITGHGNRGRCVLEAGLEAMEGQCRQG